jgi:hypothetical protein
LFNHQRLLGSTIKGIRLDTRKGVEIKNQIEPPPSDQNLKREQILLERWGGNWKQRVGPRGVYNCAAHVWASRRTSIIEESEWIKIYDHDSYRTLNVDETPEPGDLIIYADEGCGFLHVGLIIGLEPGLSKHSKPIPKVLSKWDSASGEYIHYPPHVPFRVHFPEFQWKYWTDR